MAALTRRETGGALAPIQQLKSMLGSTGYQAKLQEILGERKSQFVSALTSLVSANDQLQKCRPETVIKSAIDAAIMGLPIQPGLGFAYIVPYGQDAQFQIGWKGLVQLVLNTGQVERMNAGTVKTGQLTGIDQFQEPVFDWSKPGSDIIGFWAGFRLLNGYTKMVYISKENAIEHAKKYSKAYQYDLKSGKAVSPWSTNFEAMGTKTAVKMCLTWAPKVIEMVAATAPKALDDDEDIIETTMQDVSDQEPEAAEPPKSNNDDDDIVNFEVE